MLQTVSTTVTSTDTNRRRDAKGSLYIGVGVFMILVSVLGFGPSLIMQSGRNGPPTPLVIAHGIVTAAWLLLFLLQATLIASKRISLHRSMGVMGAVIAAVLIPLGHFTLVDLARRGYDLSGDLGRAFPHKATVAERALGLLPPLQGLLTFGALVAAGLWYRRRPAVHKRLMLLATLLLVGPPVAHLAGFLSTQWPARHDVFVGVTTITIAGVPFISVIWDKVTQKRVHPVSLWLPIVNLALSMLMNVVVMPSTSGHQLAMWLYRMSLRAL